MSRRYYFWIVASDEGKPYLLFGGNSEQEARQKGMEMLAGLNFDIKRYPTRDQGTASAYLRGKRLEQTHSLKESGKRIGHNKSLKRLKRRRKTNEFADLLW